MCPGVIVVGSMRLSGYYAAAVKKDKLNPCGGKTVDVGKPLYESIPGVPYIVQWS